MGNILASLGSSAGALRAYENVFQVAQNDVANANTPGFAKQSQSIYALPFDLQMGTLGGVRAGVIMSARSEYAEQSVRRQTTLLGAAEQNASSYAALQNRFDISADSGISNALNSLFDAFSAWAQSPTSTVTRQTVMERAADLASAFRQTAQGLNAVAQDTERQLTQTVDQVNSLVGQLRTYNQQIMAGARNDSGIQAGISSTLEELSQLADITCLPQADGSVTVLLNGQTPLLLGDRQYTIGYRLESAEGATYPDARPAAHLKSADGADITVQTEGGQLGALLDFHNRVLASYMGGPEDPGDLNRMAMQFADRVNQLLENGNLSDGDPDTDTPPVKGSPLFTYDTTSGTNAAASLAVTPGLTTDQLAAVDPGPPYVSNGVPLALSVLSNPLNAADKIDGASFTEFFGTLAARVGSDYNDAQNLLSVQQSTLAQAKDLRQQAQGVDLNEEAAIMLEFQRGYEANSRIITILDQLTQYVLDMLQR